eukprot:GHRQ01030791.1.p1 GENE.GHRQ01030791.1~~GHRQ01030791.1.p1  ORF type:complete len:230 (-),score=8.87 GHRQ01030791.1:3-692(-)
MEFGIATSIRWPARGTCKSEGMEPTVLPWLPAYPTLPLQPFTPGMLLPPYLCTSWCSSLPKRSSGAGPPGAPLMVWFHLSLWVMPSYQSLSRLPMLISGNGHNEVWKCTEPPLSIRMGCLPSNDARAWDLALGGSRMSRSALSGMMSGLKDRLCGDRGVSRVHGTLGATMEPPAATGRDKAQHVYVDTYRGHPCASATHPQAGADNLWLCVVFQGEPVPAPRQAQMLQT